MKTDNRMGQIETFSLESGVRVVMQQAPTEVVYCGIAVDAGTRDEMPSESGMAHFTEHMSFKGTERRRSWHITQRMDAVGGDLNAFTGKEETVYYCTCMRPHLARAVDVLFDIVQHSVYPQHEMDKEVEVVVAEIESYNDSPAELIYDEFEAHLFEGHPLGRNILGEADLLRQHTTADMQAFVTRMYRPERMTFFFVGNVESKKVLQLLNRTLAKFPPRALAGTLPSLRQTPEELSKHETITLHRECHQHHVMLGARAYGANDPRHLALFLLNNILGGPAMSSRLNQLLREQNGLVYTVESTLTTYTDTGVWAIYFGCAEEDVKRCLQLVHGALHRLTDTALTTSQLARAKEQLKGQLGISFDNYESLAIGMGKRFLHYGTTQTPEQLFQRIDRLTAEDLLAAAQDTFDTNRLTTLVMA